MSTTGEELKAVQFEGAKVQRYIEKPVKFRAVQFTGENIAEVMAWLCSPVLIGLNFDRDGKVWLETSPQRGPRAEAGDWLVWISGTQYSVYTADEFKARFEAVES